MQLPCSSKVDAVRLYRPGLTREAFTGNLEENLLPVYQAARNVGFELWQQREKQ